MKLVRFLALVPNRPILWMATILHAFWAMGLILIPERIATSTGLYPFSSEPRLFGIFGLVSAGLAFNALFREWEHGPSIGTFWLFIPQQVGLMISAGSVIYFVSQGHFADGTIVPGGSWFIFMDQLPKVLLAALHPFGLLRMHLSILPKAKVEGRGTDN